MTRPRTSTIAAGGFLLLAALGLFDALALSPLVLAPSSSLAEVWGGIALNGDLVPVLVGPVVWGLVCVAASARHLRAAGRSTASRSDAVALIGLGALGLLHEGAAFGMDLWLSNHLPPFEGGSTALGDTLALMGAAAIIAGLLLLAVRAARRRGEEPTA